MGLNNVLFVECYKYYKPSTRFTGSQQLKTASPMCLVFHSYFALNLLTKVRGTHRFLAVSIPEHLPGIRDSVLLLFFLLVSAGVSRLHEICRSLFGSSSP